MKKSSVEVDAYIARSADFARPILKKIRKLYHQACPQIEETIKWGFPHFEYKGLVGSMAAFKKHACFGFWKGKLLTDRHNLIRGVGATAMSTGNLTNVSELPADKILLEYIREAVALNKQGVGLPPRKRGKRPVLEVPAWFVKALATFEAFSPTNRREYVEWVTEAKQEATRIARLATAIKWMAQGKSRNWKYERKKK